MNRTVIYARVSSMSDRQSTERQIEDLTRYAEGKGYEIVKVFQKHISGAKSNQERGVPSPMKIFRPSIQKWSDTSERARIQLGK